MSDSDPYSLLPQVAHVFKSEQNVILQRENRQLRNDLEMARICVDELFTQSLNNAIASYDLYHIQCNCYFCFRRRHPTGSGKFDSVHCELTKAVASLISENSLILAEHSLWGSVQRDYCPKVSKPWYWKDSHNDNDSPPRVYCPTHAPLAHIYRNTDRRPTVDFRWGRLAWETKTVDELKPLLNLIKQLRSYEPETDILLG
jgi:hypothetical protein